MRERHNIVGSEVDRPRPPFYTSPGSRLQVRRGGAAGFWVITALALAGGFAVTLAFLG